MPAQTGVPRPQARGRELGHESAPAWEGMPSQLPTGTM
jgi:hypothetical protein